MRAFSTRVARIVICVCVCVRACVRVCVLAHGRVSCAKAAQQIEMSFAVWTRGAQGTHTVYTHPFNGPLSGHLGPQGNVLESRNCELAYWKQRYILMQ